MFLDITFQNLSSSLAITSLNLFSLIFLSPIKDIFEIFVISPLSNSKIKSTLPSSIFFTFESTLMKLYPNEE